MSNPYQRKGRGGRPLIIADHTKYIIDKPDISCPWGVEMVWCILSPKNATAMSKIQKIIVGSFYSKPNSKAKRKLLDHISEVYHMMHSRFKTGLYFIFGADCNELKLDDILNLSPHLKQVVDKPTHNDKILDPIITDLHTYYQSPIIEKPLEADSDSDSASDHKIVGAIKHS